jgi:chorismate dehydratase
MNTIKISAVSYLNTFPFVLGIKTSGELDDIELQLDVPSLCAEKLKSGLVDLALVPAGAIPEIEGARLITDFCIGAEGNVKTVLLLSQQPLDKITTIHLDFDSRTSVALVRLLARDSWKINPEWVDLPPGKASNPGEIESLVAIGDKTFALASKFPYIYDLAGEWVKHTGLPFVFAAWATTKELPEGFLLKFNHALAYGIGHIPEVPEFFKNQIPKGVDCLAYFRENISYGFDDRKHKALDEFLRRIMNYELREKNKI